MFNALVKSRFLAMFSYMFRGSRLKKKRSVGLKIGIALLGLYVVCCFAMMFGMFFGQLCEPFHQMKIDWLYFAMAGMVSMALMFIGSVFMTQTQLYEAKDNELLLSMPIPPKYILASRMVMLLIFNMIFEVMVVGPAGVIYCITIGASVVGILFFLIVFLLLPFFALALSCLVGWIIAIVISKVRNKSFITMLMSLSFLGIYFYGYSKMNVYIQKLVMQGDMVAESIKGSVMPLYWLGASIAESNIVYLVLFAICAIIPFIMIYVILSVSFIRITTTRKGFAKIKYKEQSLKVNGVKTALLKRELKHLVSSPMYMMNAGLGVVFTVAGAVALIIKQDMVNQIIIQIPEMTKYIGPAAIIALCSITTTNIISAPSISLEGKNLWIVRSFPVDTKDILMAKVNMHIVVCLPAIVFAEVMFAAVLRLSVLYVLLILLLPTVVTIFCAMLGVVINLHFPKFDWISETVAVKQSMSTIISMFASFAAIVIPVALYVLFLGNFIEIGIYMVILTVVFTAVCIYLYYYLGSKGKVIFERL